MQSIAKQYQLLPSQQEELPYSEWLLLVGGIMEDTPLGQTVLIRKEKDPKRIKSFTPYERQIYIEWRSFTAARKLTEGGEKKRPEEFSLQFEKLFASMFG